MKKIINTIALYFDNLNIGQVLKNKKNLADFSFVTFSRVVFILCQFVNIKQYTNLLSNSELGVYFLYITIAYSVTAIFFVPLDYYQQSKIHEYIKRNVSLFSLVSLNSKLIGTIIIFVQLVTVPFYLLNRSMVPIINLLLILAVLQHITNSLKGLINNLEHRITIASILIAESVLKIMILYFVSKVLPSTSKMLIVSNILTLGFVLLLLVISTKYMQIIKPGEMERYNLKKLINFSWPISLSAGVNWLQLQGYRMVLVPLGFTDTVGIYSTVSNIGSSGMGAFSAIYNQLFSPYIYKTRGTFLKNYIINAMLPVLSFVLICLIFSDFIVSMLTREDIVIFSKIIVLGIIIETGNFLNGALSIVYSIYEKTLTLFIAPITGFVVMVLAFVTILIAKAMNPFTIGLPLALSQVVVAGILLVNVKKVLGKC